MQESRAQKRRRRRRRTDASGVESWARSVELSTSRERADSPSSAIQSLNVKLIFSLSRFFFFSFTSTQWIKIKSYELIQLKLFLAG